MSDPASEKYTLPISEDDLVDAIKYAAASTKQSLDTTPYVDMAHTMLRRLRMMSGDPSDPLTEGFSE